MKPLKIPPPKKVPVAAFPKPPLPPQAAAPLPPLPPAPPQMNNPVGPPPAPSTTPVDYHGYVELAKKVTQHQGPADKAQLWATLAAAAAQKEIADRLADLVAYITPTKVELPDGDDEIPSAFSEDIAYGVSGAAEILKDRVLALLPPEIVAEVTKVIKAKGEEAIADLRGGSTGTSIFSQATKGT